MRIVRILVVALVAGCAVLPAKEGPPIAAIGIEPRAAAPAPPAQSQSAAVVHAAPAKAPASVAAVPPPAKAPATVVAASPPAKAPAGVAAAAPAIPPIARKPEPPLDMAALKARLRATNAIGVFTKLALKNQVDDLLEQFRAHHQSGQKAGVASLRQPYDMLVLKVLAVVQDGDPSLARTISGSREAIWEILADPQKFNAAA